MKTILLTLLPLAGVALLFTGCSTTTTPPTVTSPAPTPPTTVITTHPY